MSGHCRPKDGTVMLFRSPLNFWCDMILDAGYARHDGHKRNVFLNDDTASLHRGDRVLSVSPPD